MIRQRVDHDTVIHARPAAVIATSWRHTTARAVADRPPDPQLHSHVRLHGTELARQLHQLGFQVLGGTGRGRRYVEIAGVPAETLGSLVGPTPPGRRAFAS